MFRRMPSHQHSILLLIDLWKHCIIRENFDEIVSPIRYTNTVYILGILKFSDFYKYEGPTT